MNPDQLSAIRARLDEGSGVSSQGGRMNCNIRAALDVIRNHISNIPSIGEMYAPALVEHCCSLLDEVDRLTAERDAAKAEVAFLKRNYSLETAAKLRAQLATANAALAERQDSAQNAVEWRPSDQRVFLDGVSLRIVYQTGGLWMWSVYWPLSHRTQQGQVATEAEAKSAAIAAARGTK